MIDYHVSTRRDPSAKESGRVFAVVDMDCCASVAVFATRRGANRCAMLLRERMPLVDAVREDERVEATTP